MTTSPNSPPEPSYTKPLPRWIPHPAQPYFFYDAEGNGFSYFVTEEERDAAANEAIQEYLDDGWSEDVEWVVAGKLTHAATMVDKVNRPPDEELNEDDIDQEGRSWDADWDYICNYKLMPL